MTSHRNGGFGRGGSRGGPRRGGPASLPKRPPPPLRSDSYSSGGQRYPDSGSSSRQSRDYHRNTGDRYRDGRQDYDAPYHGGGASNANGSGDSYRPPSYRPPQGSFTFSAPKPPGIGDVPGGYGNLPPPPGLRNASRGRERYPRGGRNNGPFAGGPRSYRRPFLAADRPILRGNQNNGEVLLRDAEAGVKYKAFEELSDDEELVMEISSDSDQSNDQPAHKRARLAAAPTVAEDSVPKWSNPDPYTALPPPDASQRKKKDVVKLIRKARVQVDDGNNAGVGAAEEFISFADSDSESGSIPVQGDSHNAPPDSIIYHVTPTTPSTQEIPPYDTNSPLGSRKRTFDDELKPPDYGPLRKNIKMASKGNVCAEWRAQPGEAKCPWVTRDHSTVPKMGTWLHNEIMDFYTYVKPQSFEHQARERLIEGLEKAMSRNRDLANSCVFAFGSFMSELYLPTADMDLVICSRQLSNGGQAVHRSKSFLHKFAAFLRYNNLCRENSVEVISKARVPLVKYIDRITGLKVDISFENMGGVIAVRRFKEWKTQYPAMPILVPLIKHYLGMRQLNEPVNGGIGGFSVICLVVSMLQLLPQVQSGSVKPEENLGEMLMEFFDLYGNHFKFQEVAISLDPPGYINKNEVVSFPYRNLNRLSIIDPNNIQNDISGGSSNFVSVQWHFHEAYEALQRRMDKLGETRDKKGSILEPILGGNYKSFRQQRNHLRRVHQEKR